MAASEQDFDFDLPLDDPHNLRVAQELGYKYDPDYPAYRNREGLVVEIHPNHVDCWR